MLFAWWLGGSSDCFYAPFESMIHAIEFSVVTYNSWRNKSMKAQNTKEPAD